MIEKVTCVALMIQRMACVALKNTFNIIVLFSERSLSEDNMLMLNVRENGLCGINDRKSARTLWLCARVAVAPSKSARTLWLCALVAVAPIKSARTLWLCAPVAVAQVKVPV